MRQSLAGQLSRAMTRPVCSIHLYHLYLTLSLIVLLLLNQPLRLVLYLLHLLSLCALSHRLVPLLLLRALVVKALPLLLPQLQVILLLMVLSLVSVGLDVLEILQANDGRFN